MYFEIPVILCLNYIESLDWVYSPKTVVKKGPVVPISSSPDFEWARSSITPHPPYQG